MLIRVLLIVAAFFIAALCLINCCLYMKPCIVRIVNIITTVVIVALMAISVVLLARHIRAENLQPEPEPEIKQVEEITTELTEMATTVVITDLDFENLFDYPDIVAKFGEPMLFNQHSLRNHIEERMEATGFADAVTYSEAEPEEKAEDGWIEQFVIDETRSNPIYADMMYSALAEIGIMTEQSAWSQDYALNRDDPYYWVEGVVKLDDGTYELPEEVYEKLLNNENVNVSEEFNWYSSELVWLFELNSKNLGIKNTKDGWKVVKMYSLDADAQRIVELEKTDKYDFYVFEFDWKDGTKKYLGINTIDYRILILEPTTPTTTPKPKPAPTPTPTTTTTPVTPDCGTAQNSPDAPSEGKDNNLTDYEPTQPDWPDTPTIISGQPGSGKADIDTDAPPAVTDADGMDQNSVDDSKTPTADNGVKTDPIGDGTVNL